MADDVSNTVGCAATDMQQCMSLGLAVSTWANLSTGHRSLTDSCQLRRPQAEQQKKKKKYMGSFCCHQNMSFLLSYTRNSFSEMSFSVPQSSQCMTQSYPDITEMVDWA